MTARFVTGRRLAVALALSAMLAPGVSLASEHPTRSPDVVVDAPLSVLEKPANLDRIGRDVTFQFASSFAPTPLEGRLRGQRKVVNTGDAQRDCEAALVKTLEAMAKLARKRGGNKVINIRSFWDGYPTSSADSYKCARGPAVTAVSLVGVLERPK
ncbi:MAG: excinuclease ATPase subunit [Caulobacter sp.]|nr:excinuclease ATPase subunit [Caulobacter sp.]